MKEKLQFWKVEKLFDLSDKVTFISGIGGIGGIIAEAFARNGSQLILADIDEQALQSVKKKIKKLGLNAVETYKMDVTQKKSISNILEKILRKYDVIDIFINTSGIAMNEKAINFSEKDIDRILSINLKGTILCNQFVGRLMSKQRRGKIINIGSIGGHITHTLRSMPYAAFLATGASNFITGQTIFVDGGWSISKALS
jgi:gluconate 5-dehydrogenase